MMKEEIKYLVIDCTNGEGYSSPQIHLLGDKTSAKSLYHEYVGINITSFLHHVESGYHIGDKRYFTVCESQDEDGESIDGYGCHLIEVKSGQTIVLNCDFVNELSILNDGEKAEQIIKDWEIQANVNNETECCWVEEDSHEACTTHVDCQDTGTHYVIIEIK